MRRVLACVAVAAVLASAGCKASGGDDPAGGTPAGGTAVRAGDAVTAENAPVSAAELCAGLAKAAPRIEAVGSEVGAMAQLTTSIADIYGDHLDKLDGDVVDEQARTACPDVRADLLEAAGIKSFGEL